MTKLYAVGEVPEESEGARVGGRPIAPAGTPWPRCRKCDGPLRFIAQHPLDDGRHVLAFQCENDPGMCDEWDPTSGGNLVLTVKGGVAMSPPAVSEKLKVKPTFGPATGLATKGPRGKDVGLLGGEPDWIQADETPECCGEAMRFVMQLDEAAHPQLNFCGGGAAYVFVCTACSKGAYIMQQ